MYFICDVIFEKLSELRQISCIVSSSLSRNTRFLISGQIFNQSLWELVQMESTCFKTLKLQNLCKVLGERCETGALYGVIFQSSSKQFQSNISQQ